MGTEMNRRALIWAGTAAAVLSGGMALAIDGSAETPATDDGVMNFARAWLARWTENGGSFTPQPDGSWMIGWLDYYESPARIADQARLHASETFKSLDEEFHAQITRDHNGWLHAFHSGRMREGDEMLRAVPGAVDAVKTIVRANPAAGLPLTRED